MESLKLSKVFMAATLASAFAFTACGNDSSSASLEGDNAETMSVKINESAHTIVATLQEKLEYCIVNDDRTRFQMKTIPLATEYQAIKYEFQHDTLLIYSCGHAESAADLEWDDCDDESKVAYVGGKNGNIYGTWTSSGCTWYDGSEEDDDEPGYYCNKELKGVYTIEIGKNTITSVYNAKEDKVDLGTSEYLSSLIAFFGEDWSAPYPSDIFYSTDDHEYYADTYDITISNRSATSATLVVNKKNISINVNAAQKSPRILNLSVSSGDLTCKLNYMHIYDEVMNSEYCKAENDEFFDYDYDYDDKGNKFYYVEGYLRSNKDDFEYCLNDLRDNVNGTSASGQYDWKPLAKKAVPAPEKAIREHLKMMRRITR